MNDDFDRIYRGIVEVTAENARRRGIAAPVTERAEIAAHGIIAMSLAALLDLDDDHDFVVACYQIVLGRTPSPDEVRDQLAELRDRALSRDSVRRRLLETAEFRQRGVHIEWS